MSSIDAVTLSHREDSARLALRILKGREPLPDGPAIKREQIDAALANDDEALALWGRVRWRWAKANGFALVVVT